MNTPRVLLVARALVCCLGLCAASARAVVLDFEKLADGVHPVVAAHSASYEYASLGVIFSGGGGFPGQPLFRSWNSLSSLIAKRPPGMSNRFLLSTFQQRGDSFLDILISFTTPARQVSGDVVFNPIAGASAYALDASHAQIGAEYFASGSPTWIAGRFSFESEQGISAVLLHANIAEVQMGLDNLAFNPVPEPSRSLLMLAGIAALGGLALRRAAR